MPNEPKNPNKSESSLPQWPRTVLAGCVVALSWLLMQVIHEGGHVCGASLTGGRVKQVVLVPWELSRTDLRENPSPLIVCWAGPILGVIVPVVLWLIAQWLRWATWFWWRFLAGFCLIANGAYIGVGAWTHDGDSGDLIRHGAPVWTLVLFGLVTVPLGLFVWHGLGKFFGFGTDAVPVPGRWAVVSMTMLGAVVIAEILFAKIALTAR